jgi:hypothetical protein
LILSGILSLEQLILDQNSITHDAVRYFIEKDCLKVLSVVNNGIDFHALDYLPENHSLVRLNLSSNNIDDRCCDTLKKLASIPSLESLDLSSNKIGRRGAEILIQYRSASLTTIDLTHNIISVEELYSIACSARETPIERESACAIEHNENINPNIELLPEKGKLHTKSRHT